MPTHRVMGFPHGHQEPGLTAEERAADQRQRANPPNHRAPDGAGEAAAGAGRREVKLLLALRCEARQQLMLLVTSSIQNPILF